MSTATKALNALLAASVLAALGCSSTSAKRNRPGASLQGAPRVPVSRSVMDKASPPTAATSSAVPLAPDQLIVPGTYRLMVIDGKSVLVRETDPRKILTSPAVQIVASEPMGTDLSIQPALLPQEVTEEIVKNRAQTDAALRAIPSMLAELRRQAEEIKQLKQKQVQTNTEQGAKAGAEK